MASESQIDTYVRYLVLVLRSVLTYGKYRSTIVTEKIRCRIVKILTSSYLVGSGECDGIRSLATVQVRIRSKLQWGGFAPLLTMGGESVEEEHTAGAAAYQRYGGQLIGGAHVVVKNKYLHK